MVTRRSLFAAAALSAAPFAVAPAAAATHTPMFGPEYRPDGLGAEGTTADHPMTFTEDETHIFQMRQNGAE